jgi:pimeloyl-ACP methyl ester carboxylesterase/class 3 adenylate cyclase/DNA-binding CsgD family transcriptional regulator
MEVQTRYARLGNASVAYQTVGEGEVDLVFVPCWISHLERLWREPRFAQFVERLATFGRVILFDKRGTGLSDPAPATSFPTIEERMEDLVAVLDAAGSRRAVLVGSAIGGGLSALFAATYPERVAALITFGSGARGTWAPDYPWAPTPEEHERRIARLRREWGGPVMVDAYASSLAHDPEFRRWWAECLRSGASPAAAVAAERLSADTDVRHALPMVQAPTLVLHRAGDRLVEPDAGRYLAAQIAGAQFVELAGNDHLPFVGDQEALFGAIEGFLAGAIGIKPTPRTERVLATILVAQVSATAALAGRQDIGDGRGKEARTAYLRLVEEELARHRGRAVRLTLDGIVATFDGPARAVRCAESLAEGIRRLGLRARIGLHAGEVEIAGDTIGGRSLHLAKRIASHARPGEIVVSGTVVGLVAGSGLPFAPVEDREPGGLPADCRLYRYGASLPPKRSAISATAAAFLQPMPGVSLTPRENEVVALIAEGRSNREIGSQLSISIATVERHVANIMTKLGARSRARIAVWAMTQERGGSATAVRPVKYGGSVLQPVVFAAD